MLMHVPVRVIAGLAALVVAVAAPAGAADAPAWLMAAARMEPTALESKAAAVVLHDEEHVTVAGDGRLVTRRTYAVKVLTRDGQDAAALREIYTTKGGEVRALRAWIVNDGRSVELGRAETVDLALADNDIYNESRLRVLTAGRAAVPGIVFGGESEVVERTVFTQIEWRLRQLWPVRLARRVLTLPPSGSVRSVTLGAPPIQPVREGASHVWTVRDLPGFVIEPDGPPASALGTRVAVTYDPGSSRQTAFESWTEVAGWLDTLVAPQSAATPELTARARTLTAGAATDLDRIRAVGRHAQQVQYISIQTGLGRGGGYTPHAASDVLARNYGDCKDKANLMKALLATLGIKSYLVTIYSGDPDYVRAEWPSPQQFNHAIVAVVLAAPSDQPAAMVHPSLGPLLFFDPTDPDTPLGELPRYLEGSQALVVAKDGVLVRMPLSRPENHAQVRQVSGTVTETGGLTATLSHVSVGEPASRDRRLYRSLSREDYARLIERDARALAGSARVTLGQVGDEAATNRFQRSVSIEATGFAQAVNRLLIVRPPELRGVPLPETGAAERLTAVQVEFSEVRDLLDLGVPASMTVDELPEPQTATAAFGNFSVEWLVENGRVKRSLRLRLTRSTVAPAEAPALRTFVQAFRDAERAPVVLAPR